MSNLVLQVEGMSCGGCAATVERVLRAVDGVAAVRVELDSGRVTVDGEGLTFAPLAAAVEKAGFGARAPA